MIIDTHCHIYYDKFNNVLEDVIKRAQDADIKKIICVGVDLNSSEKCLNLTEKYSLVYMTAGIHPHEAKKVDPNYIKNLEIYLNHPKNVALGEIGLDYQDDKLDLAIINGSQFHINSLENDIDIINEEFSSFFKKEMNVYLIDN